MIKDMALSFFDNFNDKVRNPFLGTYVMVWIIRNWSIIYTVLNFDEGTKLTTKLEEIERYFYTNDFFEGLLRNIGWTLLLLVITYLLKNISLAIVTFSERQISPWIEKKVDSDLVVTKERFEIVKTQRDDLQKQLSEERDLKASLETEIQNLKEEINKLNGIEPDIELNDIDKVYNFLNNHNLIEDFKIAHASISNSEMFSASNDKEKKSLEEFIDLGLIVLSRRDFNTARKFYKITELGQNVIRKIKLMKLDEGLKNYSIKA